jgi:hypothetical protein
MREPDRHNGNLLLNRNGWKMIFVKESDLSGAAGILAEKFDGLAPCGLLTSVEFPKVKDLPLEHPLARDAPVFHNTPVEVLFAVLSAFFATEEHASSNHRLQNGHKGVGRHYKHF